MKRFLQILLPVLMLAAQPLHTADNGKCLQAAVDEMNAIHQTGYGGEDPIFNAVSTSMLGWGVGLFVGIALLTGLIHSSRGDTTSASQ